MTIELSLDEAEERLVRLGELLERWSAVGAEIKRCGVLRRLDFDLALEIGDLLWEPR